jgi:hypothetical protein
MVTKWFEGKLANTLEADGWELVLAEEDHARLLAILPSGEDMWLAIREDRRKEDVLVERNGDLLLITERSPEPERFRHGARVRFEVSVPVVTELILKAMRKRKELQAEVPVTMVGAVLPGATVGIPWEGTVVFNGSAPLRLGIGELPSWMDYECGPNYLRLFGTPIESGDATVAVAGTNAHGAVVTQAVVIGVLPPE